MIITDREEMHRKFEEIHSKMLNKQFVSAGTILRFRDCCVMVGYNKVREEEKDKVRRVKEIISMEWGKGMHYVLKEVGEILNEEELKKGCGKECYENKFGEIGYCGGNFPENYDTCYCDECLKKYEEQKDNKK